MEKRELFDLLCGSKEVALHHIGEVVERLGGHDELVAGESCLEPGGELCAFHGRAVYDGGLALKRPPPRLLRDRPVGGGHRDERDDAVDRVVKILHDGGRAVLARIPRGETHVDDLAVVEHADVGGGHRQARPVRRGVHVEHLTVCVALSARFGTDGVACFDGEEGVRARQKPEGIQTSVLRGSREVALELVGLHGSASRLLRGLDRLDAAHELVDEVGLHVAVEECLLLFTREEVRFGVGEVSAGGERHGFHVVDAAGVRHSEGERERDLVFTGAARVVDREDVARTGVGEEFKDRFGLGGRVHDRDVGSCQKLLSETHRKVRVFRHLEVQGPERRRIGAAQPEAAACERECADEGGAEKMTTGSHGDDPRDGRMMLEAPWKGFGIINYNGRPQESRRSQEDGGVRKNEGLRPVGHRPP